MQEHISVSLHQPEEVQKLVERSHAEEVIRWNAQTVAARLRVLADDILTIACRRVLRWKSKLAHWKKSPASIRIIRLGNSAIGISAASPACCAPKNRSMPVTYWPINSGEYRYSGAEKLSVTKVSRATQCRTTQCDVKRCQPDGHRAASAEVVLDPDDGIAGDAKWLWRHPSEYCSPLRGNRGRVNHCRRCPAF